MLEIDAPQATTAEARVVPRDEEVAPMAPAFSADLPSTLRYSESPIQRRAAVNGISPGENEAVRRLSGGRVDLHGMGASLQRVPAGDARLAAVGARSYAQGRHALVSEAADRGHELWHLAQQAMGWVRPTTTIQGRAVNAQPSLEQEAERLGALINQHSPSSQSSPTNTVSAPSVTDALAAPIQRKVTSFEADTDNYLPPVPDLIDEMDHGYFTESVKTIDAKIRAKMIDPKTTLTVVPTYIRATIKKSGASDTTPDRKTHMSGVIGKIGAEEFGLRSGRVVETFEGGHLIPHEVWSTDDPEVNMADNYANLVPMSRTTNVNLAYQNSWRAIEKAIIDAVGKMKSSQSLKLGIDITHTPYLMSYETIARLFGLTPAFGKNVKDTISLYNWLPASMTATQNPTTTKEVDMGTATENPLHDVSTPITNKAELITALQASPLWDRMNPAMQTKVSAIT